ncbi:MAG: FG-GAP repeat domain-containing protein [Limisphaerales bacterium]
MRLKIVLVVFAFGLVLSIRAQTATNVFTFTGHETYPIDDGISLLHVADMSGDGLNDIVVADNEHSQIDILENETGKTNRPPAPENLEINELPPGARFHIDPVPTDERVASLAVSDFSHSGRPDMVFYGDGKDLEIIHNLGTNGWSSPDRWHVDDGSMDPNALAVGDLNGDGLADILLLGDNGSIYLWAQKPDHTFGEPRKIPYSGTPKALQIADINGDGRNDLLLIDWDSPTPFRFRLQNAAGQLGPEIYFKSKPVHAYIADYLEGNSNLYVLTIDQNSDRAEVSQFVQRPATPLSGAFSEGQFQVLPLKKTDAAHRGRLWADVNGDGRPDLLVAQPETGEISIYLQQPDGSLAPPETFPSLAGVSQLAAADWNGDGHPEIFMLSTSENSVGVTEFDKEGRLPFPTLIPLDGKPLVMAVGPLKPHAKPTLCVIVDKNGQRSLVTVTANGKMRSQKLSDSFKGDPTTLAIHDVNQDGLADLVVLIPYEKIKVLLQKAGGDFDEEDVEPPGGEVEQPWLASADVNGDGKPELLLPQNNFIRAVVLEQEKTADGTNQWVFRVQDQINGAQSDSSIVGATAVQSGKGGTPAIFLLDSQYNQLTMCERDSNGVWRVTANIELPIAIFDSLQSVALGGTNMQSVAFMGQNTAAWLPLGGMVWKFQTLDGYNTSIKDGYLNDLVAGDLTGDGRKDLVFMETAKNYLDIVQFNKEHKLVPAERWQVFEAHTFRGDSGALPEPREALVANVTGGKKNDLIILVHDRIVVYPQE